MLKRSDWLIKERGRRGGGRKGAKDGAEGRGGGLGSCRCSPRRWRFTHHHHRHVPDTYRVDLEGVSDVDIPITAKERSEIDRVSGT